MGGIAREELVRKVRGKHDLIDEALAKLWIHGGVQLDADDRVLAGMNVNVWEGLEDIKDLVRSRVPVDPDRLADPGQPLAGTRA